MKASTIYPNIPSYWPREKTSSETKKREIQRSCEVFLIQLSTLTHGHIQKLTKLLWKFRNLKIYTTDFEKHCGCVGSSVLEEHVKIQTNNPRLHPFLLTHECVSTSPSLQFVALLFTAFIKE